jgi:GNAT superfamily N-acetyltransferase
VSSFSFQLAASNDTPARAAPRMAVADQLTRQYGCAPWSSEAPAFAARIGNEIVSTPELTKKKPWGIDTKYFAACRRPFYLLAMAVTPAKQRQGIGKWCLVRALLPPHTGVRLLRQPDSYELRPPIRL